MKNKYINNVQIKIKAILISFNATFSALIGLASINTKELTLLAKQTY